MIGASVGLSIRRTSVAVSALLIAGWMASGVGTVATGIAPLIVIVAVGQAVAGLGNGLENIAADTLIQRAVPREMLGRVFGIVSTAAFGGSTLAFAIGGPLMDLTSARTVFVIAGVGILAMTAVLWFAVRHSGEAVRLEDPLRGDVGP
jgi:MFS family permease